MQKGIREQRREAQLESYSLNSCKAECCVKQNQALINAKSIQNLYFEARNACLRFERILEEILSATKQAPPDKDEVSVTYLAG